MTECSTIASLLALAITACLLLVRALRLQRWEHGSLQQANADLRNQLAVRERMEMAWRESEADLAITLHSLGEFLKRGKRVARQQLQRMKGLLVARDDLAADRSRLPHDSVAPLRRGLKLAHGGVGCRRGCRLHVFGGDHACAGVGAKARGDRSSE